MEGRPLQMAQIFAVKLLCLSVSLGFVSFVVALSYNYYPSPDSCGYSYDQHGEYYSSSSSPDTIGIRVLADGETQSWLAGIIKSDSTVSISGWDNVEGGAYYYLHSQCSIEGYEDDLAMVEVVVKLYNTTTEVDASIADQYEEDHNDQQPIYTGETEFPSGSQSYRVELHGRASANGGSTGSYSEADFNSGSLELSVVEFYVVVSNDP